MTTIKARPVRDVMGQRTSRLRRLYLMGTLPTKAKTTSTARVAKKGTIKAGETTKRVMRASRYGSRRSGHFGEHFRNLDAASAAGGQDAPQKRCHNSEQHSPPKGVSQDRPHRDPRQRQRNPADGPIDEGVAEEAAKEAAQGAHEHGLAEHQSH